LEQLFLGIFAKQCHQSLQFQIINMTIAVPMVTAAIIARAARALRRSSASGSFIAPHYAVGQPITQGGNSKQKQARTEGVGRS
jgi:hypothetical protein